MQLRLDAAWGMTPTADARKRLINGLNVVTDRKANLLTVSYEDRLPARARSVVAAIAERATAGSRRICGRSATASTGSGSRRSSSSVAVQLATAEDAFRAFRERNHVVDLAAQIKATVEQAAALERLRIDKTLDVRFARAFGERETIEVQKGVRERDGRGHELDGAAPAVAAAWRPAVAAR